MATVNLTQKAYKHLQTQLSGGSLLPGTVVSEMKVANELGISRTPVGQAIRQLVSEGLMEQVPRYGTVVREITRKDIEDLYELREAMEPYAARKAAAKITTPQIEQLRILCRSIEQLATDMSAGDLDALEGESLREFLAADLAFHLYILRFATNERMLRIVRESRFVSQVFRMRRARHDSAMVKTACECHRKILRGLEAGDGESAAKQMFEHIRKSKEETLAFIDRGQHNVASSESSLGIDLCDSIRDELARAGGDYCTG